MQTRYCYLDGRLFTPVQVVLRMGMMMLCQHTGAQTRASPASRVHGQQHQQSRDTPLHDLIVQWVYNKTRTVRILGRASQVLEPPDDVVVASLACPQECLEQSTVSELFAIGCEY